MEDLFVNQALEGEEALESGGQEGVVDSQKEFGGAGESTNHSEDADPNAKRGPHETQPRGEEDEQQSEADVRREADVAERRLQGREDNAAARAARLRAQQETEARLRAEYDAKVSGLSVVNPYTGKAFSGFVEFESYAAQYQKDQDVAEGKRVGKSAQEVAEERENKAYIARKRQEEQQERANLAAAEQKRRFLTDDFTAFVEQFPGVDVEKLEANPKFRKFAGKRLYQEPLSELYGDFVELIGDAEKSAAVKTAGKLARGTGSGGGGESVNLTPSQDRELEAWNRENPRMKMTAKEFLGR